MSLPRSAADNFLVFISRKLKEDQAFFLDRGSPNGFVIEEPPSAFIRSCSYIQELPQMINQLDMSHYNNIEKKAATLEVRRQLLFLRICHAVLSEHSTFLDGFQCFRSVLLERLSSAGSDLITTSLIRGISRMADLDDRVHQSMTAMTSVTTALLDILTLSINDSKDLQRVNIELRWVSENILESTSSLRLRLASYTNRMQTYRSMNESASLRQLSLLASVFLPLALASSILSMQTRLVDLGYLLYDFLGVMVLLGTITMIVALMLRAKRSISVFLTATNFLAATRIMNLGAPVTVLFFAFFSASFLVGMLKNVRLGTLVLSMGVTCIFAFDFIASIALSLYKRSRR
jgi:hypothetical protein